MLETLGCQRRNWAGRGDPIMKQISITLNRPARRGKFCVCLKGMLAWSVLAAVAAGAAVPAVLHAQAYVPGPDAKHQRIRFSDSLTTLNDRCIVKQNPLNLNVRPV